MEFSSKPLPLQTSKTGCAIVAVFADKTFSDDYKRLDSTSQDAINRLIKAGDFTFKAGHMAWISTPAKAAYQRLLLVCIGASASELSLKDYTHSLQAIARTLATRPVGNAIVYLNGIDALSSHTLGFWAAEVFSKQAYRYTTTKKPKDGVHALKFLHLSLPKTHNKAANQGLAEGEAVGHGINLARELGKRFGTEAYAAEELIAEIGAAFLCADLAITPEVRDDHACYVATWLKVLKNDSRAIVTAAAQAERAAAYLHTLVTPGPERPDQLDAEEQPSGPGLSL